MKNTLTTAFICDIIGVQVIVRARSEQPPMLLSEMRNRMVSCGGNYITVEWLMRYDGVVSTIIEYCIDHRRIVLGAVTLRTMRLSISKENYDEIVEHRLD